MDVSIAQEKISIRLNCFFSLKKLNTEQQKSADLRATVLPKDFTALFLMSILELPADQSFTNRLMRCKLTLIFIFIITIMSGRIKAET